MLPSLRDCDLEKLLSGDPLMTDSYQLNFILIGIANVYLLIFTVTAFDKFNLLLPYISAISGYFDWT